MKKLQGMKLSQIFAFGIIIVVIVFMVVIFVHSKIVPVPAEEKNSSTEKTTIIEETDKMSQVLYTEGDEELDYNFILNPEVLNNYPISYEGTAVLGDKVNKFLKTSGYTGRKLTIVKIDDSDSLQLAFDMEVSDSKDILHVKYDLVKNEFKLFMELY